jgi:transposase-like protein
MAGKYKTFSPEFREEAARMVVETSRAIADVARELGISETSLGNWVRAYREKHAEDEPPLQHRSRSSQQPLWQATRPSPRATCAPGSSIRSASQHHLREPHHGQ